jgi:virginiamycin B lyase
MLGRLDPETGDRIEIDTEPRPYGIQVDAEGTLWVAYNGTNRIGALDPETMEIRYYTVPDSESRVRRLGLSSDGMVWYVNSTRGRIGRLDPESGDVREWLLRRRIHCLEGLAGGRGDAFATDVEIVRFPDGVTRV